MKSRIMYIEHKAGSLTGDARIGRFTFSQTGKTIYHRGKAFARLKRCGFKANHYDPETGEQYWIAGPMRDGSDRLCAGKSSTVTVNDDVQEEHWITIRGRRRTSA